MSTTIKIPATPYPYQLPHPSQVALLIIDMQRDFIEPGGFGEALGNDVQRLRSIIPNVQRLLDTFRQYRLPIFQTVEGHKPDLSDCPPSKRDRGQGTIKIGDVGPMGRILVLGELGNGIIPELTPLPDEIIIPKPGKGAFFNTDLETHLQRQGITHLVITGVTTEVCVQTTMREANDRGYECLLVEDATESYFPAFKQATLDMVCAQGGIVGWVGTTEDVVSGINAACPCVESA